MNRKWYKISYLQKKKYLFLCIYLPFKELTEQIIPHLFSKHLAFSPKIPVLFNTSSQISPYQKRLKCSRFFLKQCFPRIDYNRFSKNAEPNFEQTLQNKSKRNKFDSRSISEPGIDYKFNAQANINISATIIQPGSIELIHKDKSPKKDQ